MTEKLDGLHQLVVFTLVDRLVPYAFFPWIASLMAGPVFRESCTADTGCSGDGSSKGRYIRTLVLLFGFRRIDSSWLVARVVSPFWCLLTLNMACLVLNRIPWVFYLTIPQRMMMKKALESPEEVAIYQRCNILDLPWLPGLIAFIVVSCGLYEFLTL